MKLFLLRHGKADWPDWKGADDERPLTDVGASEMRVVALGLKRMKVNPSVILSSPLPRALRTAEIVAETLGVGLRREQGLGPGFDRERCDELVAAHAEGDLMLVGHEPDFTGVIRALTSGRVKLRKGGIAAVELDPGAGSRLLWLFTAKILVRIYR